MQAKTFFFWLHIVLMVKTVYIDALQRKTGKGGEEKGEKREKEARERKEQRSVFMLTSLPDTDFSSSMPTNHNVFQITREELDQHEVHNPKHT